MQISCVIIDDEPLARKGLKEYIEDVHFLELVGEFESPLEAADFITGKKADLIFLDIEMPKISGLQFLKTLQPAPPVIFTTAYPQYALDGFDLNALDYLVKPISFERFLKAAIKAKEYYALRKGEAEKTPPATDYIFIKADNKLVKIVLSNILFVEALQNYVLIYTTEKKYITYLTFHAVEEHLPAQLFIKTHKSFLVSLAKIDTIEGNIIHIGQHSIPISRTLKEAVLERLTANRFLKR